MPIMDPTDINILKVLWEDGRKPYYQVGEEIGLSGNAVKRRVEQMIRRGELEGFSVFINPRVVPVPSAVVEIRTRKHREEVLNSLKKVKGMMHLVSCLGGRYYGEFWYFNEDDLESKLLLVKDLVGAYEMKIYRYPKARTPPKMKRTDWRIIRALKNDGRMPLKVLSKVVGVSVKTVANRLERMVEQGVMRIGPVVNRPKTLETIWFSLFIETHKTLQEARMRKEFENLWRTDVFSDPPTIYGVFYARSVHQIDDTIEELVKRYDISTIHYEIFVEELFLRDYVDYVSRIMCPEGLD